VVVSEERGGISLARGGQIISVKDREEFSNLVQKAITPPAASGITWWERSRALIVRRWPLKIGTLGLVCVFWLLLAGQQNFEVSITVPLEIKNLPVKMEIMEPLNPEVRITVRGLRKDASTLNNRNVHAGIDLSMARFGNRFFRITRNQIDLPNDRINIVHIEPSQMEFTLREVTSKD